ncbi:MAG: hypothetical protein WD971_14435 [Pirellulales bacterium]
MAETFDPYYVWLGIAPDEQPADHYRLLGLRAFEANADVIDHAADRQMAHLRSFSTGKRAALAQRLLNEISAARICLHDADAKAKYDDQLRAAKAAIAAANAPPVAVTPPQRPVLRAIPVTAAAPQNRPMPAQQPAQEAGSPIVRGATAIRQGLIAAARFKWGCQGHF